MTLEHKLARVARNYSKLDRFDKYIYILGCIATVVIAILMSILALRAMFGIELRWDSFFYHIPFAAIRGGLDVPYEFTEYSRHNFEGFPPLPHLVQGLLWRITGSINATNVINYIAFVLFLGFCGKKLKTPIWLVTAIALTSPMVLIHTTVTYVDLFANSLLAIGVSSLLYAYFYEKAGDKGLLVWGMMGLIGAAWSKFQLVPVIGLIFTLFIIFYLSASSLDARQRKTLLGIILFSAVIAALPYVKNIIFYHNPFWPVKAPIFSEYFPYSLDLTEVGSKQRPPPLMESSQFALFFHSLLEINHPTSYSHRARWIIDQGNSWLAFRMGGNWYASVIVCLVTAMGMTLIIDWRKGIIISLAIIATLCFIAALPQSHELRYYLFIPLTWAALIGMLFNDVKARFNYLAFSSACLLLGMFFYSSFINREYYEIKKVDYLTAAETWNASRWWDKMQLGTTYCAVGMEPIGFFLTGPTMSEYKIIERQDETSCPQGTVILKEPFIKWQSQKASITDINTAAELVESKNTPEAFLNLSLQYYEIGNYEQSIEAAESALSRRPDYVLAYNNICSANIKLKKFHKAIVACEKALKLDPNYDLAENNLRWAKDELKASKK